MSLRKLLVTASRPWSLLTHFIANDDSTLITIRFVAPRLGLPLTGCVLFSCLLYAIVIWIAKALIMKYTLKLLLCYKGWMYETRSAKGTHVALVSVGS